MIKIILSALLLLGSCAKEQSESDRLREKRDRETTRMQKVIGTFEGYAIVNDQQNKVPVNVTVGMVQNPSEKAESPKLQSILKVGLFGGVAQTSDKMSLDWETGKMSASFKRAQGTPLEFTAVLKDNNVTDAFLITPYLGNVPLELHAVQTAPKYFLNQKEEFDFSLSFNTQTAQGNSASAALLSLKRVQQDIPAPATSNLSSLPSLEGSLRFQRMGSSTEILKSVMYDPLIGTFELTVREGVRIVFNNIFLPKETNYQLASSDNETVERLSGNVVFGANGKASSVVASPSSFSLDPQEKADWTALPPRFFKGTFKGNTKGISFATVAQLEYLGTEGSNSNEYIFSKFPKSRLKVTLCYGKKTFAQKNLELFGMDHLGQLGWFESKDGKSMAMAAAATGSYLKLKYTPQWSRLTGQFSAALGSSSETSSDTSSLDLRETDETGASCAQSDTTTDSQLIYNGHAVRSPQQLVPSSITVFPKRSGGGEDDTPTLLVQLRTGFFGGVVNVSEPAFFDWSSGKITAQFKRNAGPPLEVKATLTDDRLTDAEMVGPNMGAIPLQLAKTFQMPFEEDSEFFYRLDFLKELANGSFENRTTSVVSIKRKVSNIVAPSNSDLPFLLGIDSSVRLFKLGQAPQIPFAVIYDPLKGTMTFTLSDSTTLDLENLFVTKNNVTAIGLSSLSGRLAMGGNSISTLSGTRLNSFPRPEDFPLLPHDYYVGTFQGSAGSMMYKAIAYLDYMGTTGKNSPEVPFPFFPSLRLKVITCLGNEPFSQKILDMIMVNALEQVARFKSTTSSAEGDLDISFTRNWSALEGRFANSSSSSSGNKLILKARQRSNTSGCTDN